uniref:ATP-dependent DNA helicase n=1 Tax=Tanacetum cinerariifolium TaxID=118510 RepID=A0A699H5R1_TANCI|nr:ATP-dependent DNA helicase PIF1-like [Tanacetum cinerariifolium]
MTRGDTSAAGLGKRIVLPQTYVGSPRHMMHNYQDAMALCQTYGNPDLFVTFTSNLEWPKIAEMLAYIPGQKSHDRLVVRTRVFKMKLIGLLEDLTKHHVFGKYCVERPPARAYTRVLEEEFKCRTPDQINNIISTELPCPTNDPDTYKLVSEFMLHGSCGVEAKHAPCTNEGKCSKHYPKKFLAETIINEDGYPVYRRRYNIITAFKGKFTYDNRHVVPHNRGAQYFTDLKMVNKINYATFKAACFVYGLLNDDKEWIHAIADSSIWAMAQQLHGLFVTILLFCDVSRPLKLWEENWVRNYCLLEIQDLLNTHGKSLTDFKDLPQPNPNLLTNLDNRLLREALSFYANKSKVEHEKLHSMLNPKQRLIYEQIIDSVHNEKGQFCFIHGPGGTWKMFLYKTIIARLRSEQMIVLTVVSSELLQHVRLIIWDEAPMTQRYAFKALDKTLQYILGYKNQARRNRIFRGMTVLLGGDFHQILPVIPNAKRPEIVAEMYLDFTLRKGDDEYLIERAILTPWNDDADAIDENMFKKLRGAPVTYNSADEICKASTDTSDQYDLYPVEFLNSLNFQEMPLMPSA